MVQERPDATASVADMAGIAMQIKDRRPTGSGRPVPTAKIQTVRCSKPDHGHLGKAAFGRTRQGSVGEVKHLTLQQVEGRQQKEVATRDRRKKRQQTAHPGRSISRQT